MANFDIGSFTERISKAITTGNITTFSTGGTAAPIDYTGIPSWAKRVTVMFNGVKVSNTSTVQVQVGSGRTGSPGYGRH